MEQPPSSSGGVHCTDTELSEVASLVGAAKALGSKQARYSAMSEADELSPTWFWDTT
jgi:hypothetical protein